MNEASSLYPLTTLRYMSGFIFPESIHIFVAHNFIRILHFSELPLYTLVVVALQLSSPTIYLQYGVNSFLDFVNLSRYNANLLQVWKGAHNNCWFQVHYNYFSTTVSHYHWLETSFSLARVANFITRFSFLALWYTWFHYHQQAPCIEYGKLIPMEKWDGQYYAIWFHFSNTYKYLPYQHSFRAKISWFLIWDTTVEALVGSSTLGPH